MANEIYHRSNWGNAVNDIAWGDTYEKFDATNEMFVRSDNYENSNETDKLMAAINPKPSILLTPTAYDNGSLHSVKPVQTFGSELITNGDFSSGSTGWTSYGTVNISNGIATIGASSNSGIFQAILTQNKSYKVTLNVLSYDGVGNAQVTNDNGLVLYSITQTGLQTFNFKHTISSANIIFRGTSNAVFSIDNVSVKEVTDADFDFTRGSSATRVNEKGLIEDVQILSGELVQNGDFSQIGSEEVTNGDFSQIGSELITNGTFDNNINGWSQYVSISTWDNGTIKTTSTSNLAYIRQNNVFTQNKQYKVTFKAKATNISQNIKIWNGSAFLDTGLFFDVADTYKEFTYYLNFVGASIHLIVGQSNINNGDSINFDNVSVKEVGQDWTLIEDVNIGNSVATFLDTGSNPNTRLIQSNILTSGKAYKLTFEVTRYVAGRIQVLFGSSPTLDLDISSGVGTYTIYGVSNGTDITIKRDGSYPNFDFNITNISVKEVGQNWTFGTGWNMGDDKAICDGTQTSTSTLQTSVGISGIQNNLVSISFELSNYSAGLLDVTLEGSGQIDFNDISSNGVYSAQVTSADSLPKLLFNANADFIGSIDNVSIIKITKDTNLPRIDYTSGTGSLLLEPQSTNLLTYSEDFSNNSYSKTDATVTSGFLAPDGTNNATKLITSANDGQILFNIATGNTNTKTVSVFAKADTTTSKLRIIEQYYVGHRTDFDLNLGVIYFNNSAGAKMEDYGNGWYKCTHIQSYSSGQTNAALAFRSATADSFYLWGAQLEEKSFATSYIPTNGSTVTRLADVCNNAGSSDLINSTEGVLYAEIAALANDGTVRAICISNGTAGDAITIRYSVLLNLIRVEIKDGGVQQFFFQTTSYDFLQFVKLAIKYKANDCKLYINGVQVATDTSATMPSGLNTLNFDSGSGNDDFYGNVKCVAVFKEALSDTELQKLTTI